MLKVQSIELHAKMPRSRPNTAHVGALVYAWAAPPTCRTSGKRARYRVYAHSEEPTCKRASVPLAPVLTRLLAHVEAGAAARRAAAPAVTTYEANRLL